MSNILTQRWLLNRRHFLRGLGSAVALPMLDAMRPLRAAVAVAKPRRCVFAYIPNGVNVQTWQLTQGGRDYEMSEPLRALEKHRENISPISGLHHPGALNQQHVCADSWLTAASLSNGESAKYQNTVSCDQLMAEVTSTQTRFASLELSISGGVGQPRNTNTLAYSRDGIPLPADDNPSTVFNRLFGEEVGSLDAQRERIDRRRSVLDAVLTEAKSLRRTLGTEDQGKLDEYLHSVREVEVRTERLNSWLTVPKPKVDGAPFQRNVTKAQAGEYYRTMYDLIVLALRTDMTRVVTYLSGSESMGLAIPEIGIAQSRHELSHHNGDPAVLASLTKSDVFLVQQFAYFLDQLKSVDDSGEPLLDRTMVLFGSGMSYGHSHGNANLPIIVAGGRGLGLRHGQHIDYNLKKMTAYDMKGLTGICHQPVNRDAHLANLLLALLQKMEVNVEQFADSLGPVSELV